MRGEWTRYTTKQEYLRFNVVSPTYRSWNRCGSEHGKLVTKIFLSPPHSIVRPVKIVETYAFSWQPSCNILRAVFSLACCTVCCLDSTVLIGNGTQTYFDSPISQKIRQFRFVQNIVLLFLRPKEGSPQLAGVVLLQTDRPDKAARVC